MLGEKLMKLRRKSGMSQQDVAGALSVSRQTISNWEGDASAPDIGKAKELAALFRISLDDLVNDEVDVTVAEGGSPADRMDLHVLTRLKGATCKLAMVSGWWMPQARGGVRVIDVDADWVRVEYDRLRCGRAVELVDMNSVAGFQIVALPDAEGSDDEKAGETDGCERMD